MDKSINPNDILGCFIGHTPLSDHLPIILDLKIGNAHYDGSFIRLPFDKYENTILLNNQAELNTIRSSASWFPYITKNMLNNGPINRDHVNIPMDEIISRSTLIDRIPFNKLVADTNILNKPYIIKHINKKKLNIILFLQKRPLFNGLGVGYNLVDENMYDLIENNLSTWFPMPSTWYYGNYDIRTNVLVDNNGYIYPSTIYKVDNDILTDFLNNYNLNTSLFIEKIFSNRYDIFVSFEIDIMSKTSKWISLHALCYYLYAKTNNLSFTMPNNFDKTFKVQMGLYPLNNEVDYGTIPVNKIEQRSVYIHPANGIAFSPPDQTSFVFKDINKKDNIYATIVESIKYDNNVEILTKPIITLHVYNTGSAINPETMFEGLLARYTII